MISFKDYRFINELVYSGNIGVMEMIKFHRIASNEEKKQMKEHLKNQENDKALELLNKVTGAKLEEQFIFEMPYLNKHDTPEEIAAGAIGIRNTIDKEHKNAEIIDPEKKQYHLKMNGSDVYYRHDGKESKELSYISNNIQVGTIKPKCGDSSHIHDFMLHHLKRNSSIESSNSNTNGSKNLWINFIKKNPQLNHVALDKRTNTKTKLNKDNIDKLADNIWGTDLEVHSNIRIISTK